MSNQTFNVLWKNTQTELEELAVKDFQSQEVDPIFDRVLVQKNIFELYVKYI